MKKLVIQKKWKIQNLKDVKNLNNKKIKNYKIKIKNIILKKLFNKNSYN